MNRKRLLLTVLLLVLAGALVYAYLAMPTRERLAARNGTENPGRSAVATAAPEGTELRLDLLEEKQEPFPGYRKNIFGSILPPPPEPAPAPKPVAPPPPTPQPAPEPAPAPSSAQRELARFTFLGYLEKEGEKSVFLGRDENLFVVSQGSRFGSENQFRVAELTPEQLTITQQGDERRIVVELVDQSPLVPQFRRSSPRGAAAGESPAGPGRRPARIPAATAPQPRGPAADDQLSPDTPPGVPEASNEVMQ